MAVVFLGYRRGVFGIDDDAPSGRYKVDVCTHERQEPKCGSSRVGPRENWPGNFEGGLFMPVEIEQEAFKETAHPNFIPSEISEAKSAGSFIRNHAFEK